MAVGTVATLYRRAGYCTVIPPTAYMWNSWYSLSMWNLWAPSSRSDILSQLCTTMTAESHWQHFKHMYLGFMHRPRLDQTVYTMIHDVIPAEVIKARDLDGKHLLGWPAELTTFQEAAKKAWIELAKRPCSATDYVLNIKNWTCRCGGQQLQAHHLCKHLVQAVEAAAPRPANFFEKLTRRRTMPIYKFSHLSVYLDLEGSISDGDDDIWMGSRENTSKGAWRLIHTATEGRKRSWSPSVTSDSSNKKVPACYT